MTNLTGAISRFARLRVLVVGDVILDRFLWGNVERINPEAPVPVIHVRHENSAPGGAANAAANVASLGARAILAGYVGKDAGGETLSRLLRERKIKTKLVTTTRRTSTKVRAIARGQQLLRLDYEENETPSRRFEDALLEELRALLPRVDAVLVSDYGKGVVTRRVMELVTQSRKRRLIITVDPKPAHVDLYRGVTLITPNTKEAGESLHRPVHDDPSLREVGRGLSERLEADVLITRGEYGMSCFERDGGGFDLPTVAKEVIDVTGAGDTVIATVTLALAAKIPLRDAVRLANIAAGLVVSKVGTATVNQDELKRALLGA